MTQWCAWGRCWREFFGLAICVSRSREFPLPFCIFQFIYLAAFTAVACPIQPLACPATDAYSVPNTEATTSYYVVRCC